MPLFHYAGHADAYTLLLQDAGGNPVSVAAGGFAAFLAAQPGLQIVFLNACSTEPQVADLLAAGVRAVVATSTDINDAWAAVFAEHFYKGLAGGAGLAASFQAAERAVRAEVGDRAGAPWAQRYLISHASAPLAGDNAGWPWALFPAPDGGVLAAWKLRDVQTPAPDYLWVNVCFCHLTRGCAIIGVAVSRHAA